ncbi:MAG: histidine phosphatase family protein [Acidobacteriota bacterium]
MTDTVHLMRHGAVDNPGQIRYGRIPGYELSEQGREQARRAAGYLRTLAPPVVRIVASPLDRTIETAEIMQRELELPAIATDERLIEAFSDFDGLSKLAFLDPHHWRKLRNPFVPSWGEPFRDVAARMHAAIAELRAASPGPLLLVTHQSPIWIARQAYRSPRTPPWTSPMRVTPGSITTLHFDRGSFTGDTYWTP